MTHRTLSPRRPRAAGFSLLELLCGVAIAGVLTSLAYPGYQAIVRKVRRSDAQSALLQAQLAQERYRAEHTSYGSLADLGLPAVSPAGHYLLAVAAASASGFELRAAATSAQALDTGCRHMKLLVDGLNAAHVSGADDNYANADAANKTCWGL